MRPLRFVLAALAAFTYLGATAPKVSAQAGRDSLVIERMDVEVQVLATGEIEVTETLRPHFYGAWNGIFRALSLRHENARGRQERLAVELLSITDGEGSELAYETERPDSWTRRWRIYVPGALDAARTVVIRYRVENAIRFFEAGSETGALDELYWNVTGNEWDVPIQRASATILLPENVDATQTAVYTGPAGASGRDATLTSDGRRVRAESTRRLQPGEGLTVGVGWPPGVVARPGATQRFARRVGFFWPLALPLLGLGYCLSAWRRYGRDPRARAIVVQYEPPEGLSPAEVGTLVDHKAQIHDVTSTLVDLAVRGYLVIEEREEKKLLGLLSDKQYVFHIRRPQSEWGELASHERSFLRALHRHVKAPAEAADGGGVLRRVASALGLAEQAAEQGGEGAGTAPEGGAESDYGSVSLDELKNAFYKDLPGVIDAIYEELISEGHYRKSPKKVKTAWSIAGSIALVVSVVAASWASDNGLAFVDPLVFGTAGVATGLLVLLFGQVMPARTVSGARARERALGFKEFLKRVESDRYRRMITGPEMFERYLPYAMALKVEDRWAEAFQGIFKEPPDWYRGGGYGSGSFDTRSFTSDLGKLSSAAGSSMASSPSGSGGGGSSGGGSGGGGGGGF